MSRINRPPQGLQSLLGSQNFGDNPSELAQAVAPVLDMLPFYGAGILRLKRASAGLASEGEIVSIEFDEPVAFLSCAAWCEAGLTLAGQHQLGLTISGPPSDNLPVDQQHLLVAGEDVDSLANAEPSATYTFPAPLVVEAGTKIHARWLHNEAGSSRIVQLTVMYYDLSQA